MKALFEKGKRTLNENDEEGQREIIHGDKDYDDNYQNQEEGIALVEKYIGDECFDDFTDQELLRYAKDYH